MARAGRIIRGAQAGFSLLEVLVVVAILSVAAYVAIDAVDNDTSQMRFELTETRLATIRRAIVGDPSITVNGSPMISGYVADVGQLPPCLEALFERDVDCNPNIASDDLEVPIYADFSSVLNSESAGAYVDADADGAFDDGETVLLSAGWRGPYIIGSLAGFADSWGNGARGDIYPPISSETFVENGWNVSTASDTIAVSTLGRNRAAGTESGFSQYDVDEAMLPILSADWEVNLAGFEITVDVTNTTGSSVTYSTCVGLIAPSTSDVDEWRIIGATLLIADNDSDPDPTVQLLLPGTTQTLSVSLSASDVATIGRRSVLQYEPDPISGECNISDTNNPVFPNVVTAVKPTTVLPRMVPVSVQFSTVLII